MVRGGGLGPELGHQLVELAVEDAQLPLLAVVQGEDVVLELGEFPDQPGQLALPAQMGQQLKGCQHPQTQGQHRHGVQREACPQEEEGEGQG